MISLIITVLNEKETLPNWLASLSLQTVLPTEIVIVDGGSSDGTWEWLCQVEREQPLTSLQTKIVAAQKIGNISTGRNYAIQLATGDYIVSTDAGCTYDTNWFAKLTTPFSAGINFAYTGFGPWLESTDSFWRYTIAAATTPDPSEFQKNWLASSRSVAFSKKVWLAAGQYPEWLPICEDVLFDLRVRKNLVTEKAINEPLVFWRPRPSLRAYCKQLFNYTRGDGHAQLFLGRQIIRYVAYIAGILMFAAILRADYKWIGIFSAGIIIYFWKFWQRWVTFSKTKPWWYRAFGFVFQPVTVMIGDVAKMAGWPLGVLERLTGRIKPE